ncbi:hypothetical protein Tcan_01877 [Toxocara canis]|uniref:Uncharacterized protein n=1 Tax=Toxocara canis TaxID=6265 RepID=A0A0B2VJT7_TOXCA|nr:hypothetical protein Tcan_01877 [Toxocara canis]
MASQDSATKCESDFVDLSELLQTYAPSTKGNSTNSMIAAASAASARNESQLDVVRPRNAMDHRALFVNNNKMINVK